MFSKNSDEFYGAFLPYRRETLDFAQEIINTKLELQNFSSFTLRQLQERTGKLLVVSELDALASFIYGHSENKKAFVDMLIEWTGNKIFSAIWPKKLTDFFENGSGHSYREVLKEAMPHIDILKQKNFQNRDDYNKEKKQLIETLCNTSLKEEQAEILSDILWRISDEDGINPDYLEQYEADLKKKEKQHKHYQYAKSFLDQFDHSKFLRRELIKQKLDVFLQSQRYEQKILDKTRNLILNGLHHGSYAACVYKFRCDCTHNFDGHAQSFSNVSYNGKPVGDINIDLLITAHNQILTNLEKAPIEEIKKMHDKYVRAQEGTDGVLPLFQSYINAYFKDYDT